MGGLSLIPQVVDVVEVPAIAAGGIADGRALLPRLRWALKRFRLAQLF
jgi:NAD(P)H-dependent flavin oxidoreductase YrpB (nitropropane dioxygenase family)